MPGFGPEPSSPQVYISQRTNISRRAVSPLGRCATRCRFLVDYTESSTMAITIITQYKLQYSDHPHHCHSKKRSIVTIVPLSTIASSQQQNYRALRPKIWVRGRSIYRSSSVWVRKSLRGLSAFSRVGDQIPSASTRFEVPIHRLQGNTNHGNLPSEMPDSNNIPRISAVLEQTARRSLAAKAIQGAWALESRVGYTIRSHAAVRFCAAVLGLA